MLQYYDLADTIHLNARSTPVYILLMLAAPPMSECAACAVLYDADAICTTTTGSNNMFAASRPEPRPARCCPWKPPLEVQMVSRGKGETAGSLENTCHTGASDGATDAYIHVMPGRQARRLAPRMIVNIQHTCDVVHPGLQSQLRFPCSKPDMSQTLSWWTQAR